MVPRQSGKKDGEWKEYEFLESSKGETPLYLKYPRLFEISNQKEVTAEVKGLHKQIVNENVYGGGIYLFWRITFLKIY